MKTKILITAFVVVWLAAALPPALAKEKPLIPEAVTKILSEVNETLKLKNPREKIGFIVWPVDPSTYPLGMVNIVGQSREGITFVIDAIVIWVSPQKGLYKSLPLVAGKTVSAVWWWENGKKLEWEAPKLPENTPESNPPAKTPTNGTTI